MDKVGTRKAEQQEGGGQHTEALTLISPYFSATSNFVPLTMNSRTGSRPLDAACAICGAVAAAVAAAATARCAAPAVEPCVLSITIAF